MCVCVCVRECVCVCADYQELRKILNKISEFISICK